jgi:hypothetical protein
MGVQCPIYVALQKEVRKKKRGGGGREEYFLCCLEQFSPEFLTPCFLATVMPLFEMNSRLLLWEPICLVENRVVRWQRANTKYMSFDQLLHSFWHWQEILEELDSPRKIV